MVSPSSGWTQGNLTNTQALFATLVIPITGTWLISFGIVITSTAVSTGQLTLTNANLSNIGLTPNQATFGASFNTSTGLVFQGSLVVNSLSGTINAYTTFSGGNTVTCLYSYSYLQATRIG